MNYLVKLEETNGDYEYDCSFLTLAFNQEAAEELADYHARHWYGDEVEFDEYSRGYEHNCGEVIVRVAKVQHVTNAEAAVLSKYMVTL